MFTHGPSCLVGPLSRQRGCWLQRSAQGTEADPITGFGASAMNEPNAADGPFDPEIRVELVERVRREIATGTYDTPEKWALALDRLLAELESE